MSDYSNYIDMRRVVNGTDKAKEIAAHALRFETALKALPMKALPVTAKSPKRSLWDRWWSFIMGD
jgi:hypothetical protein